MRVEALPPLVSGGRSWDCVIQYMVHCLECSKLETWEGRHLFYGSFGGGCGSDVEIEIGN